MASVSSMIAVVPLMLDHCLQWSAMWRPFSSWILLQASGDARTMFQFPFSGPTCQSCSVLERLNSKPDNRSLIMAKQQGAGGGGASHRSSLMLLLSMRDERPIYLLIKTRLWLKVTCYGVALLLILLDTVHHHPQPTADVVQSAQPYFCGWIRTNKQTHSKKHRLLVAELLVSLITSICPN